MKAIKQFICLLVCFVLLSSSFMVGYAADDITFPSVPEAPPIEDLIDILDPFATSTLDITPAYSWEASNTFGFTEGILSNSDFIYYENLPYGLDTIVVGVTVTSARYLLFLNGDDDVPPTLQQTWASNGNCSISLLSMSPIYRMAFNVNLNALVSFNSFTGLTNNNNSVAEIGGKKYYGFSYTFIAGDCYLALTNNSSNMDKSVSLNGETQEAYYGIAKYPTRAEVNEQLQEEQNKTTKSIWETLKSVLEYIKNLPSNIADSIKSFFSELGDRISGFFTTLKNYLLYFQAEEPEDEGYLSVNFLSYLTDYITELSSNLQDFTESLDSSFNSIESYITSGSNIINKLLGGVPILNAVLIFFLAFAVIRKAVGR